MAELRTLVCSKCLRACCWHGEFQCDDYQTAGLLRATETQLRQLNREHPDYFLPHMGTHDNAREPILTDRAVQLALSPGTAAEEAAP